MSDGRNISHTTLVTMRIKAIRAWKKGVSINEIATLFGLHRGSVSRWITHYKRSGATGLRLHRSTGRPKKVDCEKYGKEILKIIKQPADRFGFENSLWNSKRIKLILQKKLKLKISLSTVWRNLRDLRLSYQKPERRALEQDPKKRQKWIEIEWPKIKRDAKKKRAVIFFLDESTISTNDFKGKTWAPIAKTPIIKLIKSRSSVNIISAISPNGKLLFSTCKGTTKSETFIKFLKSILKEIQRKQVVVIADNAKIHKSKLVKSFLEKTTRLTVYYLPPYSPELNPDEYVWSHLKSKEMPHVGVKNKTELKKKTLTAMKRIQARKDLVKSFFNR